MNERKSVLVIGAGDSTGGAIARRFAREGFVACVTRRTAEKLEPLVAAIRGEGGEAHGFASDARKEVDMETLVAYVEREVAPIEVAVFNVGGNVRFPLTETTERVYRKVWEMGALGGFLMGREVARAMLLRGRGTIVFTGATASMRGGSGYAAFAAAKAGLRAVSQAAARELGPKNIHVAHLVIDSGVDTAWVRERIKERDGAEAVANLHPGRLMRPEAVAESYWALYQQPRDAWSSEMEIRPFGEKW